MRCSRKGPLSFLAKIPTSGKGSQKWGTRFLLLASSIEFGPARDLCDQEVAGESWQRGVLDSAQGAEFRLIATKE